MYFSELSLHSFFEFFYALFVPTKLLCVALKQFLTFDYLIWFGRTVNSEPQSQSDILSPLRTFGSV
jgi:hypothetical protein